MPVLTVEKRNEIWKRLEQGEMTSEICRALQIRGKSVADVMQEMKNAGHPRFKRVKLPPQSAFIGLGFNVRSITENADTLG